MTLTYKKGEANELSKEYYSTDFDCHCEYPECTTTVVSPVLVAGLDALCLTFPIIHVNSGFRCARHNQEVGGKPDSQHLLGLAADVTTPFARAEDIAKLAEEIDVFQHGGIGLYSSFVHLDVRGHKARW